MAKLCVSEADAGMMAFVACFTPILRRMHHVLGQLAGLCITHRVRSVVVGPCSKVDQQVAIQCEWLPNVHGQT